ncbi:MAG: ribulose-phosphate 3-epimerase [Clostridia bacterium]|nr:ribulose-phosphate 3-epimerase [Clostridia bacterium]
MNIKIAPSVMCCDFINLKSQLDIFEANRIELLHIDVMDGSFVPNFALGTDFVRQLKKATNIPLDLHFMTEMPERCLDWFPIGEGDYVSVHYETTKHLQRVLQMIKSKGAKALLAINPATPVEVAMDVLDDLDGLLVMCVNPGFAGQKLVPHSIDKIARARAFLDNNGKSDAEIEVDGNVSLPNAEKMLAAGANIFVVGTSGIFLGDDMGANIRNFRGRLEELRGR